MRKFSKEYNLATAAIDYICSLRKTSTCGRAKHACLLTDTGYNPNAIGYNGTPKGFANHCEGPNLPGQCKCIHAEVNALIKPQPYQPERFAFITCQPCEPCARMIANAEISKVFYIPGHRDYPEGLEVLDRANIEHGSLVTLL